MYKTEEFFQSKSRQSNLYNHQTMVTAEVGNVKRVNRLPDRLRLDEKTLQTIYCDHLTNSELIDSNITDNLRNDYLPASALLFLGANAEINRQAFNQKQSTSLVNEYLVHNSTAFSAKPSIFGHAQNLSQISRHSSIGNRNQIAPPKSNISDILLNT